MGYLAGKNAVVTLKDSTPQPVEDGDYGGASSTDEVTNLTSGGFYESVNTIKKLTGSLVIVYKSESPPDIEEGDSVAMSVTIPDGPGFAGNVRITEMRYSTPKPKAAVRINLSFESNGAYTKTNGTPP